MHRNTILVISFLAITAALLVGFNVGRRFSATPGEPPPVSPTPSPVSEGPGPLALYESKTCGVSFQYPPPLRALEATGGAIFVDPQNASDSVALICQKDIPRPPLLPEKMETVTVTATSGASISAMLYHDASAKDGTPIDELIFTHPRTGLDVFLAGFGSAFQTALESLKVL